MMIEAGSFDISKLHMLGAKDQIAQLNKQMNIDDIADLKDELEDMQQEKLEMQDFFAEAAQDGQEDLLDELDNMYAE